MQDYQFWAMVGGIIANLGFLWKIWSDSRKDTQVLRSDMNQMHLDLSQRLGRMEGRQEERDSSSRYVDESVSLRTEAVS